MQYASCVDFTNSNTNFCDDCPDIDVTYITKHLLQYITHKLFSEQSHQT